MEDSIKNIHDELLILLGVLHRFCIEHNIRYSLHGGTMLGAVREHGFILWDDDADVTFSRTEYDKFTRLVKRELVNEYIKYDEDSRYPKLVMRRKGHPLVWIDLFVYDYITENPMLRRVKIIGTQFFILITRTRSEQDLSNKHGVHSRIAKVCMSILVGSASIIPYSLRLNMAKKFMTMFPGDKSFVHRSNDTNVGMKMILPANVLDEQILVPFETSYFSVYKEYNNILISSYGPNYMIPVKDKVDEVHEISLNKEREYFVKKFFER